MSEFKIYAAEISPLHPVGLVVVTASKTAGVYCAESFFFAPDDNGITSSSFLRIDNPASFNSSPVELNDEFMLEEALIQARIDFRTYLERTAQENNPLGFPQQPNIVENDNIGLLVHTWVQGKTQALTALYHKTKCPTLRATLQSITNLPTISKENF